MFIHFDRMYERDRHTDKHTLHDSIGRACIASRGKNTQAVTGQDSCTSNGLLYFPYLIFSSGFDQKIHR